MDMKLWVHRVLVMGEAQCELKKIKKSGDLLALGCSDHFVVGVTLPEFRCVICNLILRSIGYADEVPAIYVQIITPGNPVYWCNDAFTRLPMIDQTSCIEHEVGHVVLEHYSLTRIGKVKTWLRNNLRALYEPKIEFEADEYAISKVGWERYLNTLIDLQDAYHAAGYNTDGINKRIQSIKWEDK